MAVNLNDVLYFISIIQLETLLVASWRSMVNVSRIAHRLWNTENDLWCTQFLYKWDQNIWSNYLRWYNMCFCDLDVSESSHTWYVSYAYWDAHVKNGSTLNHLPTNILLKVHGKGTEQIVYYVAKRNDN